eukprot:4208933-Alexandrium_andersonii.AAC.1
MCIRDRIRSAWHFGLRNPSHHHETLERNRADDLVGRAQRTVGVEHEFCPSEEAGPEARRRERRPAAR